MTTTTKTMITTAMVSKTMTLKITTITGTATKTRTGTAAKTRTGTVSKKTMITTAMANKTMTLKTMFCPYNQQNWSARQDCCYNAWLQEALLAGIMDQSYYYLHIIYYPE